jgi:F-type H+-transporting ATPase subunit b
LAIVLLASAADVLLQAAEEGGEGDDGGSTWLITPNIGMTIWTLVVFAVSLIVLTKAVFPRIREALDRRQAVIEESMDAAERTRQEAEALLAEYRERLQEARAQADEIVERARQSAAAVEADARTSAQARGEQMLAQTQRDIQDELRRTVDEIKRDVATLTILATEKVTRKTLTEADQRQLVQEALADLDFSALAGGREN